MTQDDASGGAVTSAPIPLESFRSLYIEMYYSPGGAATDNVSAEDATQMAKGSASLVKGQGGIGNEAVCETTPGESDRETRILPEPQTNTNQQPATLGAPAGRPVALTIPARCSFRRERLDCVLEVSGAVDARDDVGHVGVASAAVQSAQAFFGCPHAQGRVGEDAFGDRFGCFFQIVRQRHEESRRTGLLGAHQLGCQQERDRA
jgi:hypothetical protein